MPEAGIRRGPPGDVFDFDPRLAAVEDDPMRSLAFLTILLGIHGTAPATDNWPSYRGPGDQGDAGPPQACDITRKV